MVDSIGSNFNDQSKGTVFKRNVERDVTAEPIIIGENNGRFLVHENLSVGKRLKATWDAAASLVDDRPVEQFGKVVEYPDRDSLVIAHGRLEGIRTLREYEADFNVLNASSGLNNDLSEAKSFMKIRLEDIEADMERAGFVLTPRQSEPEVVVGFAPTTK